MTLASVALVVSVAVGCVTAYNTLTSRRSLRWQQARDAERREQHVHIHFEHAAMTELTGVQATWLLGGPENLPLYYRLRVVVVNASETSTVWIRSVHIQQADGNTGHDLTDRDAGAHRLEPGEPLVRDIAIDRLGHDFSRVIAKAHVAPNEWIQSAPEELLDDVLSAVRERNTRGVVRAPPSTPGAHDA
jgi:hypothetical protein